MTVHFKISFILLFSFSRDKDVTDISFGLSSSDVSYLKNYEVLDDGATLDEIVPATTLDKTDRDIMTPCTSLADYSGELRQQFSDLKIPSDTSQPVEVEVPPVNDFVQAYSNGLVDIPTELTQGLRVVGIIPISLGSSSQVSSTTTTTLSYATTPTTVGMGICKENEEVRITNIGQYSTQAIRPTAKENLVEVKVQGLTPTTDVSNTYVLSMTVEDVNYISDAKEDGIIMTKTSQLKENEKFPNPLETTLTAAPEPQRASTPAGDTMTMLLNHTIVAGFSSDRNLQQATNIMVQKSLLKAKDETEETDEFQPAQKEKENSPPPEDVKKTVQEIKHPFLETATKKTIEKKLNSHPKMTT